MMRRGGKLGWHGVNHSESGKFSCARAGSLMLGANLSCLELSFQPGGGESIEEREKNKVRTMQREKTIMTFLMKWTGENFLIFNWLTLRWILVEQAQNL